MFMTPLPASSSSSSTLVTTPSPSDPNAKHILSRIQKPKLSLTTSTVKMSNKGFIEPHHSHLPRRTKFSKHRERTKTAPVSDLEQVLEQQLHLDTEPPKPKVSTQPHRDNLPRRTRVRDRTKTAPFPVPLPISIVDSQSTTASVTDTQNLKQSQNVEPESSNFFLLPKLPSTALSLIQKAQNKAFNLQPPPPPRPTLILDDPDTAASPTSPQLPHPAMGLTMGIMEAYASEENQREHEQDAADRPPLGILRSGPSFSPAFGVHGTPPAFPTPMFVRPGHGHGPVPVSIPVLASALSSMGVPAGLGQNLPRRHRRRRTAQVQGPGEVVGIEEPTRGGGKRLDESQVLRFGRPRKSLVEGDEDEDGLFSSVLDFEQARLGGRGRRGREDGRCVQMLGRSCVEVGYLEGETDNVLLEVISDDGEENDHTRRRLELCLRDSIIADGIPSLCSEQIRAGCEFMKGWIGTGRQKKRKVRISALNRRAQDAFGLALCFLARFESEEESIVPFNSNDLRFHPPQTRERERQRMEGTYTAIHLLYMRLLDDGEDADERARLKGSDALVSNHPLAIDEKIGLGIVGVDLGIGPDLEDDKTVRSDSTIGASTLMRQNLRDRDQKRSGHVREAAFGVSSLNTSSSSSSDDVKSELELESYEWMGLRDEWRGVLSYEGLNKLVGIWP